MTQTPNVDVFSCLSILFRRAPIMKFRTTNFQPANRNSRSTLLTRLSNAFSPSRASALRKVCRVFESHCLLRSTNSFAPSPFRVSVVRLLNDILSLHLLHQPGCLCFPSARRSLFTDMCTSTFYRFASTCVSCGSSHPRPQRKPNPTHCAELQQRSTHVQMKTTTSERSLMRSTR